MKCNYLNLLGHWSEECWKVCMIYQDPDQVDTWQQLLEIIFDLILWEVYWCSQIRMISCTDYHTIIFFSLETSPIHRSYLMRSAGFHLLSSIPLCLMSHWFLIDNENLFSSLITHALMNSRHGICLTSIRSSHSDTYTQDSSWPQKNIVCLRWSPKPSLRSPGR